MLEIVVPSRELFDERTNKFIQIGPEKLLLEHSLVSISKWEAKWEKPFFTVKEKTLEEVIDYIKCMTISENVDPMVYECLSNDNLVAINNYIESNMTATWFQKENSTKSHEVVTSELIYYWMLSLNIDMACEHWHINRLMTLIRVFSIKNAPSKKMSKKEIARRNRELNDARLKAFNTKG